MEDEKEDWESKVEARSMEYEERRKEVNGQRLKMEEEAKKRI